MTDYNDYMETGLYREETGLLCGAGVITVSSPVAQNCHLLLRNKPSGDDVYTLGVEWLYNTDDSTWDATDITDISGKVITIGAGHNGDTFNIGYYAAGTGVAAANSAVQDDDKIRAEHPDNILSAYNRKGHVNPLEAGMVFDNAMGVKTMGLSDNDEHIAIDYDTATGLNNGGWSFSGKHPYYITCVRVEVRESAMTTGQGFTVHMYEDGTEVGEQGGVAGIYISDDDNWIISEFVDGVETWYSANIYLGMMLCTNFKVTLEKDAAQAVLATDAIKVFAMGWYVPDSLTTAEVKESFTYHSVPAPCGLYTEKVYTVSSNIGVSTEPRYLPDMDAALRTVPHARNEYRYGIEYIKNLTNDEFITTAIKEVADTIIYLDPSAASDGDVVEMGYYSYDTLGATAGLTPKSGDPLRSTDIDGLVRALDRMDRVDFGKSTFSYGDSNHEYIFSNRMFEETDVGSGVYFRGELTSNWTTILAFDPYNLNSRKVEYIHQDYTDRSTSGVDENPFFVTGFYFACDRVAVAGGVKYANGIKFKISFHSGTDSVRQHNQSEIVYYPVASVDGLGLSAFSPVPAAMGLSNISLTGGVTGLYFVPLGMLRCYSFKIDAAVEPGEAFTTSLRRRTRLQGWMIEAV